MFDIKNFTAAIAQIAEEKGISREKVFETIEMAIAAAYKKDYGERGQIIKAKLSPETGEIKFWQVKQAVTEDMIYSEEELVELAEKREVEQPAQSPTGIEAGEGKVRFNPEKHIMLEEAKKINSKIKAGEDLETPLETREDYGRIAAQTAKQVILQRIKEAEREFIFSEFKSKEGEIISGIVQRVEGRVVFMDIGKALGLLLPEEQVPGEFYRPSQRLKVYLLSVEETPKGPSILVSRAYPKIISKLFELEVPEVSAGTVVIKSVAREPGSRSKIAVVSNAQGVDPIGSMVGQRGTRVSAVINELGGEKIDIIEWKETPEEYIANSLSPAKVLEVKILPRNKALAIVQEDQLSLAIGREGQNVRLAAKLTGWKIDVRSPEQAKETGIEVEEEAKGEVKEKPKRVIKKKLAKKSEARSTKSETNSND
ncbi:MAG: transcription termination/antitermination protein NusA [Candidatus Nealsonbacteria bacterium]|nr:transcription termination/antitermination protein NusA [Candidatus Nealsonbacteria bacterium]